MSGEEGEEDTPHPNLKLFAFAALFVFLLIPAALSVANAILVWQCSCSEAGVGVVAFTLAAFTCLNCLAGTSSLSLMERPNRAC